MNIELAAETIFHIGNFPVTNTLLTSWVVILMLVVFSIILSRKIKIVPKGIQNFIEFIFEGILDLMDSVTQDRKQSYKFFPLVVTIFIFILTSNWLGLFPGFLSIGIKEIHEGKEILIPFFRSANSDLNIPLALAIVSVVATQIFGILAIGFFKYTKRFLNFQNPIKFFIGILELVSELAKVISFSFRLFGNIFAGEVLLIVIAFLIPLIVPLPFYFLEIFVGFIQAFIFAILTLVFLKFATTETH